MELNNNTSKKNKLFNSLYLRELGIFVFLVVLIIAVAIRNPDFISSGNIRDILIDITILGIVSIGQMAAFLTGGIDLSVGSIIGFSSIVVGLMISRFQITNPILAILLGLVVGVCLGAFNGFLIVRFKMPAIIVTLGTLSVFRGLAFIINFYINKGQWIDADKLPTSIKAFAQGSFLKIPNYLILGSIIFVFFYYFFAHTIQGRKIYAVGSNIEGARAVGINISMTLFLSFLISGALSGIGGSLWVERYAFAQPSSATGFELLTITAVIIGGISVKGGSGSITGLLLGIVLMGVINSALNLIGLLSFWRLAITGFIILAVVIFDQIVSNRVNNLLLEKRKI
ncbi:MAG: ABC transporter permease [Candidatus Humimicrobiaceae bacterium]